MNILGSVGGFVQYCFGLFNKDVTTDMETSILSCSPSNLASSLTLFFFSFSNLLCLAEERSLLEVNLSKCWRMR